MKLRAQKVDSNYFYAQLPLNEDGNDLDKQLSYTNYKETVRKSYNTGWKNSYHTSADISLLGYGCGISMYPQFFVEDLKTYQMLPLPYMRYFDGEPADQVLKQK